MDCIRLYRHVLYGEWGISRRIIDVRSPKTHQNIGSLLHRASIAPQDRGAIEHFGIGNP